MTNQSVKGFSRIDSIRHLISCMANLRIFWASSIFLTICLIGIMIFQVQALAQSSEFVFQAQSKLAELSMNNGEEGGSSSLMAMSELDELAQLLDFEKIDKVHYIRTIESTVLAK